MHGWTSPSAQGQNAGRHSWAFTIELSGGWALSLCSLPCCPSLFFTLWLFLLPSQIMEGSNDPTVLKQADRNHRTDGQGPGPKGGNMAQYLQQDTGKHSQLEPSAAHAPVVTYRSIPNFLSNVQQVASPIDPNKAVQSLQTSCHLNLFPSQLLCMTVAQCLLP